MTINQDVYSFDLLRNGADVTEVTRNSSQSYLENLLSNKLIRIEDGKIFLTDKGEVAKKIGLEKYLQLEKYEERIGRWNKENRKRDLKFLKLTFILVGVLAALLFYIISTLS